MSDPAPPTVSVSTWTDPVFWVTTIGAIAAGIAGTGVLENWTQTFSNDVKLWVSPASYVIAAVFLMYEAIHAHLTAKQILSLLESWFASVDPTPAVSAGGVKVSSSAKRPVGSPYNYTFTSGANAAGPYSSSKVTYPHTTWSGSVTALPDPPDEDGPVAKPVA